MMASQFVSIHKIHCCSKMDTKCFFFFFSFFNGHLYFAVHYNLVDSMSSSQLKHPKTTVSHVRSPCQSTMHTSQLARDQIAKPDKLEACNCEIQLRCPISLSHSCGRQSLRRSTIEFSFNQRHLLSTAKRFMAHESIYHVEKQT